MYINALTQPCILPTNLVIEEKHLSFEMNIFIENVHPVVMALSSQLQLSDSYKFIVF